MNFEAETRARVCACARVCMRVCVRVCVRERDYRCVFKVSNEVTVRQVTFIMIILKLFRLLKIRSQTTLSC